MKMASDPRLRWITKMKSVFSRTPITLERVIVCRMQTPKRIDLAGIHSGQLQRKTVAGRPNIVGTFSAPFAETIKPIFEASTGLVLFPSTEYGNFWRFIESEEEFAKINDWVAAQGSRIFLRDCLNLSIALDCNFEDAEGGGYTKLGSLEHLAKSTNDVGAIACLSRVCVETIGDLPYYREAKFVAAVPAMSVKSFDLPSQISSNVAEALGKQNLTTGFECKSLKEVPLKEARVEDKWALLEKTGLRLRTKLPKDADVVLIDDKYQSGTTMQFVAMKLQKAGARYVFGISLVKTLRDTDNASKE